MEGLQDDMGDGSMQCADHPYKNNIPPGGICASCLQEKLGKLVSSSFPIAVFPSSSPSPSSPSFRSENFATSSVRPNGSSSSSSTVNAAQSNNSDCHHHHPYYSSRRARIPFLLTSHKKKKKKKDLTLAGAGAPEQAASMVFKRSKSTTTPGRRHFMGSDDAENEYRSPRKRGFWSFLYLSSSKYSTARRIDKPNCNKEICYSSTIGSFSQRTTKREEFAAAAVVVEEEENDDDSPNHQAAAFDRKVSRSRSVGCGSRSFSGDFFERISTGFGDCTLRRVESQREGKPKVTPAHRGGAGRGGQDCIKERVKCGGLFSGFMITSSSSTSSSSSYWVSSSAEDKAAAATATVGHLAHGRSKSWGWAFASPIRAFSKPSSGRREGSNNNNKNTTPNLNAIPSLLAVRG